MKNHVNALNSYDHLEFPAVLGDGSMVNWLRIHRDDEKLFEDWYNFEHLPERLSTKGFKRARRFIDRKTVSQEVRNYLTVYETKSVDVLASSEYLSTLDKPSDVTLEVLPRLVDFKRMAGEVTISQGAGSCGRVLGIEFEGIEDMPALRRSVDEIIRSLIAERAVNAGSFYEPRDEVTQAKSSTEEGRKTLVPPVSMPPLLLLETQVHQDSEALQSRVSEVTSGLADKYHAIEWDLIFELYAPNNSGN